MKIYFDQPYSLILILLAVLLAFLFSFGIYQSKNQQSFYSHFQIRILFILRFFLLFSLMFLLLGPAIQLVQHRKLKPVFVIAIDNSESMQQSLNRSEELVKQAKEELQNYQIELWTFGERVQKNGKNEASEVRSDYSGLFQTIQNSYPVTTIDGIILLGDGIFNSGTDPVFASNTFPFPVFTVGLGDSARREDAAILKVTTNPTAFLDNIFPVEINLSYQQFAGKLSKISIWKGQNLVYQDNIAINENDFFQQKLVRLKADKSGLVKYRIEIEAFPGEKNKTNNEYEFTIHVIDKKQKILLLSHSPHPDLAALTKVLGPLKNYSYDLIYGDDKIVDVTGYDLIIMHQLPDYSNTNGPLIKQIVQSKRPVLWIIGKQTSVSRLNNLHPGFTIQTSQHFESASAAFNSNFNLFKTEVNQIDLFAAWPPLTVPFSAVQIHSDWQSLIDQRIQGVETNRPLICLGRSRDVKYGLIMGEGIWRWRLYNFVQNGSHEVFDQMIQKMVNYLILKPNEDNFTIFFRNNYAEDQDIGMQAELLNESFEPITDPDISIAIIAESGIRYNYVFDKQTDHYELNVGHLPAGSYTFEASVNLGDNQFKETGLFNIDKVQLEHSNTQANFNLLYQISKRTGGKFVRANQFPELLKQIVKGQNKEHKEQKQLRVEEFISVKWFFIFILFLMGLEWFLKKYWGSY